jgi:hypothetical protein
MYARVTVMLAALLAQAQPLDRADPWRRLEAILRNEAPAPVTPVRRVLISAHPPLSAAAAAEVMRARKHAPDIEVGQLGEMQGSMVTRWQYWPVLTTGRYAPYGRGGHRGRW